MALIDQPDYLPLTIYKGCTFFRQFVITEESTGDPVSLANVSEIKLQALDESGEVILEGSIADGTFAISAPSSGGIFTMTITDEDTATLDFDVLQYTIKMDYADGSSDPWYYGPLELDRGFDQ